MSSISLTPAIAAHALHRKGDGSRRGLRKILAHYGSFTSAARHLLRVADLAASAAELERYRSEGIRLLVAGTKSYPESLRQSADPPLILYMRGALAPADDPAVAIVGARRASLEGLRIATALGEGLAEYGVTVVSGLALGIDGAAHRGALRAGGRTIAVLGCGVDVAYPRPHVGLAKEIAGSGAVLSEFVPGTLPRPYHFPERNRIIATLARVVVVVEGAERSGSLITAHLAADEGREVLAVPGSPMSPGHRGTNRLIQEGARLLSGLEDVIEALPGETPARRPSHAPEIESKLADDDRRILALLSPSAATSLDELARQTGVDPITLSARLVALELDERLARATGGGFLLVSDSADLRR